MHGEAVCTAVIQRTAGMPFDADTPPPPHLPFAEHVVIPARYTTLRHGGLFQYWIGMWLLGPKDYQLGLLLTCRQLGGARDQTH